MPGRSREDIKMEALGLSRGVMGMTSPDSIPVTIPKRRPSSGASKQKTIETDKRALAGLVAFNILLFGLHFIGAIWAISATITKPIVIAEMRYKNETLKLQTHVLMNRAM